MYMNDDMDIVSDASLINKNIYQTVPGNLASLQETFTKEMERISHVGEDLKSESDFVNMARFIVSVSKLIELKGEACNAKMDDGSTCNEPLTFSTEMRASVCLLSWKCSRYHCGTWQSSEILKTCQNNNVYVNDMLSMACILLSGNNFTKMNLFFQFLNLQMPKESTYSRIQRLFCIPEIGNLWKQMKDMMLRVLADYSDICLCGDGRNDSPGHCARFCSYVVMLMCMQTLIMLIKTRSLNVSFTSPGS